MSFTSQSSSHHAIPLPRDAGRRVRDHDGDGASPWLWATVLAVLVVIPSCWWARHSDESLATDAPAPMARQVLPASDAPREAMMIPHLPVRPPISSQEPQPLPGNAMPSYPSQALQDGSAGSRIARLQLDVQGRVSAVTIVERQGSPDPRLDEAVVETLRQWRFEPALRDGHAVVSSVQVPVEFTDAR
ncbi:energy transducer TonB [Xanthomonas campestris]|uniref:energy transducer TonB n=1 Tax=Xanthomonas campestris TaxID=339 RepID=UPI001863E86C|nr:energy transducer TonB [Xanthomonas campestris]